MSTNSEVKTLVSPSLHVANIKSADWYKEGVEPYVSHAAEAMDTAYQSVEAVINARQKVQADPTRTGQYKILTTAKLGDKYSAQVQSKYESSWNKLNAGIKHTEAELSKPISEAAGVGNVATEIRSHLSGMKQSERMAFLNAAMERGDDKTLTSALGAPFYLSGMTELEHNHFTRLYHTKRNPDASMRLDAMKGALDKLERSKPIFMQEMERAIGANAQQVEKLKAASSEAEAALILRDFAPNA